MKQLLSFLDFQNKFQGLDAILNWGGAGEDGAGVVVCFFVVV